MLQKHVFRLNDQKKSREVTRFPAIFNVLAIIGYDPEARVIAIQRMLRSIWRHKYLSLKNRSDKTVLFYKLLITIIRLRVISGFEKVRS